MAQVVARGGSSSAHLLSRHHAWFLATHGFNATHTEIKPQLMGRIYSYLFSGVLFRQIFWNIDSGLLSPMKWADGSWHVSEYECLVNLIMKDRY
jgi:hypothetical protein